MSSIASISKAGSAATHQASGITPYPDTLYVSIPEHSRNEAFRWASASPEAFLKFINRYAETFLSETDLTHDYSSYKGRTCLRAGASLEVDCSRLSQLDRENLVLNLEELELEALLEPPPIVASEARTEFEDRYAVTEEETKLLYRPSPGFHTSALWTQVSAPQVQESLPSLLVSFEQAENAEEKIDLANKMAERLAGLPPDQAPSDAIDVLIDTVNNEDNGHELRLACATAVARSGNGDGVASLLDDITMDDALGGWDQGWSMAADAVGGRLSPAWGDDRTFLADLLLSDPRRKIVDQALTRLNPQSPMREIVAVEYGRAVAWYQDSDRHYVQNRAEWALEVFSRATLDRGQVVKFAETMGERRMGLYSRGDGALTGSWYRPGTTEPAFADAMLNVLDGARPACGSLEFNALLRGYGILLPLETETAQNAADRMVAYFEGYDRASLTNYLAALPSDVPVDNLLARLDPPNYWNRALQRHANNGTSRTLTLIAPGIQPQLVASLDPQREPNSKIRIAVAGILGCLASPSPDVVTALKTAAHTDPARGVSLEAARAWEKLKHGTPEGLETLLFVEETFGVSEILPWLPDYIAMPACFERVKNLLETTLSDADQNVRSWEVSTYRPSATHPALIRTLDLAQLSAAQRDVILPILERICVSPDPASDEAESVLKKYVESEPAAKPRVLAETFAARYRFLTADPVGDLADREYGLSRVGWQVRDAGIKNLGQEAADLAIFGQEASASSILLLTREWKNMARSDEHWNGKIKRDEILHIMSQFGKMVYAVDPEIAPMLRQVQSTLPPNSSQYKDIAACLKDWNP